MGNFNLLYGISRRTPASPKVLKEILDTQAAVNSACVWTHERLGLVAPREQGRAVLNFPFVRFGLAGPATPPPAGSSEGSAGASEQFFMQGSTRVRDNLWNAHLVAAFLKLVSKTHPGLLLELRDEGGFVVPGAVWIKNGNVEANREFLNRERARALEVTGDPQAAAPYVWAEIQALAGNHFADPSVSEYGETPELRELDAPWQELEDVSLSDAASLVVERAARVPVGVTA